MKSAHGLTTIVESGHTSKPAIGRTGPDVRGVFYGVEENRVTRRRMQGERCFTIYSEDQGTAPPSRPHRPRRSLSHLEILNFLS